MLLWGGSAHALRPDPDPPPECVADISGRVTATPSLIDRETDDTLQTNLAWSVVVPKGCPPPSVLTLAGRTVGLSGQIALAVSSTTTYSLISKYPAGALRTLARATVTVHGDPGFITVSPGRQLTADDIAKFYAQWMQPAQRKLWLGRSGWLLSQHDPDGVWGTGERMAAMARMYELTRDSRYLDHLRELVRLALQYRDDLPLDRGNFKLVRPTDEIRNKVGVPGWGGRNLSYGGLHHVEEVVTMVYAYPIAAFARIVVENPALRTVYGDDAIDYANFVLETAAFFLPQIRRQRRVGGFIESTMTNIDEYRNRPTEADCTNAYNEAMRKEPGNKDRWDGKRRDCNRVHLGAGSPLPHNVSFMFSAVLIELSRVLDSPFYSQSPKRSKEAERIRFFIPLLVSRQQRYFVNRLFPSDLQGYTACQRNPCWHYADDLPSGVDPHIEDTDHSCMDMIYLGVLHRNLGRLNVAAERSNEPIPLTVAQIRGFARTFVENMSGGTNLKGNVAGDEAKPADASNSRCEGWLELTRADARVYQACHDVTLRIVDGKQPYLNQGNHSALLANKQYLPPP